MNNRENANSANFSNRQFLFQAIYEACYETIESLASSAGPNRDESHDIAQVVFMRFDKALLNGKFSSVTFENGRINGNMVLIRAWLFSATLLVTQEFVRTQRRQDAIRRNFSRVCGIDQSAEAHLLKLLVKEALDQCSPTEQSVMTMKVNGYSCREIAATFDRSPSTIRAQVMSARNKIRNWLDDDGS